MRLTVIAAIAAVCLSLAGCGSLISAGITAGGQAAPAVPNQVTSIAEAEQAATLITKATQAYVDNAKLTKAQLVQISADSDALHSAITTLESQNGQGVALNFAAVNAALAAWNTYTASLPGN